MSASAQRGNARFDKQDEILEASDGEAFDGDLRVFNIK